jgi:hypothetical protein
MYGHAWSEVSYCSDCRYNKVYICESVAVKSILSRSVVRGCVVEEISHRCRCSLLISLHGMFRAADGVSDYYSARLHISACLRNFIKEGM